MLNILTIQRSKLDKIAEYYKVIRLPSCDDNDEAEKISLRIFIHIFKVAIINIITLLFIVIYSMICDCIGEKDRTAGKMNNTINNLN